MNRNDFSFIVTVLVAAAIVWVWRIKAVDEPPASATTGNTTGVSVAASLANATGSWPANVDSLTGIRYGLQPALVAVTPEVFVTAPLQQPVSQQSG